MLIERGYETLLPLQQATRNWSDRIKVLEQPLFPGYVFCKLDITDRLPVLQTTGVTRFVGLGASPSPVDADEMEGLLAICASGLPLAASKPQIGQEVRILRGPLKGLVGPVVQIKNEQRLVISVSLLNQAAAVVINSEAVEQLAA